MILKRRFSRLLVKAFEEEIPKVKERVKILGKQHGNVEVGKYNIGQVLAGMKEMNALFYMCSQLDKNYGIRFRGMSIPEMHAKLPKVNDVLLPEGVFWLLCTGRAPEEEELADLQKYLTAKINLPQSTTDIIKNYAKTHHPMTMLSIAVMDMQKHSEFAKEYQRGLKKDKFWLPTLNDGLKIIQAIPHIAALIYTTRYGKRPLPVDCRDWAGQYANHMGFAGDSNLSNVLREYLAIHCDHEGGNVSAHTGYLINSALSDPFLSVAGCINGLAGPLHGLANQDVMSFIHAVDENLKKKNITFTSSDDPALLNELNEFIGNWLKTRVVPGYGHGKLRVTDPRFTCLKDLSLRIMPNSRLCMLVHALEKTVTPALAKLGKVRNPYPNVDAHSGVLLYDSGLKESDYNTVVFSVSRAMGVVANITWARAIGLNIERPGSLTLESLEKIARDGKYTESESE